MGIANPEIKHTKISSKDIAEADKQRSLTTIEMGGIKRLINKIRDFFKSKGEK